MGCFNRKILNWKKPEDLNWKTPKDLNWTTLNWKIMKNYVIWYEAGDKHSVLNLVRNFSNDVTIDKVEDDRVGITIELDDEEADELYDGLRKEVRDLVGVRQRHYTGD